MEMEVLSLQILDQNIFPPKISTKISCEAIILNVNLVFITFELIKLRIEKVEKIDFSALVFYWLSFLFHRFGNRFRKNNLHF